MPFPRKYLNDGEDIVLDLHPHWFFYFKQTLLVFLSVVALIAWEVLGPDPEKGVAKVARFALLGLMGVAAILFIARFLVWRTVNFVLTTDRLIYRTGVVAKSGVEIPLERLNDISFRQSILERILRTGDLTLESAGERGQQAFTDIPKPNVVQNEIYKQIEANKNRDADRMAGARRPELSIPEQLEKLDELRQRGVISPAEFEAKKQQLLDRL